MEEKIGRSDNLWVNFAIGRCNFALADIYLNFIILMRNREMIAAVAIVAEMACPLKAKENVSHFTIRELTRSETAIRLGIDNTPPSWAVENMERLIKTVLDPARDALGAPVIVNSGYRCESLNRAVGGVARSYHLAGRAADLTTGSADGNRRLFAILKSLPHVELIWERGGAWIHVAY